MILIAVQTRFLVLNQMNFVEIVTDWLCQLGCPYKICLFNMLSLFTQIFIIISH